jgi:hypothetical protein
MTDDAARQIAFDGRDVSSVAVLSATTAFA